MSRWQADDEDWQAENDDGLWDEVDEDQSFTARCPKCRAEIHDDTPCCPVCGEYITPTAGTEWKSKPGWYVALAVAGMIAVIWILMLGG